MLVSVIVLIVITIVWLLMMGFLTFQVLGFISSQLLLVAFMFGNTAKTVFVAIIFLFVMHPFDVGDCCVIDAVQVVSNSELSQHSWENVPDWHIHYALQMVVEEMNILTTVFLISLHIVSIICVFQVTWYFWTKFSDILRVILNTGTPTTAYWLMILKMYHTINFQNYAEKSSRRSELVLELKKILEDLNIKYHLLPKEVHLSYARSEDTTAQT